MSTATERAAKLRQMEREELRERPSPHDQTMGDYFDGWLTNHKGRPLQERHRAAARALGKRYDDGDDSDCFLRMLGEPEFGALRARVNPILNSQHSASIGSGGALVAENVIEAVEITLLATSPLLRLATVYRTEKGGALPWPTVDDTDVEGVVANVSGEGMEGADFDAPIGGFGVVTTDPRQYHSGRIFVPMEFSEDSIPRSAEVLGQLLGARIGRRFNRDLTIGVGGSEGTGIVHACDVGVTAASATAISADEVSELAYSVDSAYAERGGLMMNRSTLRMLKQKKTGVGGRVLEVWRDASGQLMVDEWPCYLNSDLEDVAAGTKPILFGDFSRVLVHQVRELAISRSLEGEGGIENDRETFYAKLRQDGALLVPGAVKSLQMAGS